MMMGRGALGRILSPGGSSSNDQDWREPAVTAVPAAAMKPRQATSIRVAGKPH